MIKYNAVDNFPEEGVRFIDLTPSIYDFDCFSNIVRTLASLVNEGEYDYIISPDARGFIWGSAVSLATGVPMIPVRKEGKLPNQVVGATVKYETEYSHDCLEIPNVDLEDKRCVFIDDVFATGGTYETCKSLVKYRNGTLENALVIYDVEIVKSDEVKSLYSGDAL